MPTAGRFAHPPATEVDRYVCLRIRERRIMLGLTQQELAERIGATPQQTQRYEAGTSRIFAGRLFMLAQALDVDVGYFVDGMNDWRSSESLPDNPAFFELARSFISMAGTYKKARTRFARELAERKPALVYDINDGRPAEPAPADIRGLSGAPET